MNLLYRAQQFWQAITALPDEGEQGQLLSVLSSEQIELFKRMPPNDQLHSRRVYQALLAQGASNPDLLTAALLHDVGKSHFPLHLWERVAIVIVKAISHKWFQRLGANFPGEHEMKRSWRRGFIIALHHPAWGAEMAAQAKSSSLVVELIARHQEILPDGNRASEPLNLALLHQLQMVDNEL